MHEPERMYLNPSQIVFVETVGTKAQTQKLPSSLLRRRTKLARAFYPTHFQHLVADFKIACHGGKASQSRTDSQSDSVLSPRRSGPLGRYALPIAQPFNHLT